MHSKFLKLQTALLTVLLLFSVLLPQTALAAVDDTTNTTSTTDDSVTRIVDPNTFSSWETIQGTRSITQGRIWADKTVSADKIEFTKDSPLANKGKTVKKTAGSDFLVALSALSSTSSLTKPEPQPIDIVLVLDASGSMADSMGGTPENYDSTKRIDALKTAAKNFLKEAKKQNDAIDDPSKQIKVSIVKFSGEKSDQVGNSTYSSGGYTYNYSQIMQDLTLCNNDNLNSLITTVDSINPAGATRSDYGMEMAKKALDSARSNAKKVVIFFTDGTPTKKTDYDAEVAGDAINTAKSIKDSGTTIYTVGIFSGADAKADPTADNTSSENRFMHAVSSNYPAATYSWVSTWYGGYYNIDLGTRAENSNYYKTATNSTELNTVFQDIFKDATSDPPVPTLVETGKDATNSGYVSFNDPLGDYMTVDGFNAIAFGDEIFEESTKTTEGNVDTYVFDGTNEGNTAYPENINLNTIIIKVTHSNNLKTGDIVDVQIPAALLPLRYYQVSEDLNGNVSMKIPPTYPISIFYSVSLKQDVKNALAAGTSSDTELTDYVAAHTEKDSKVYFYTNLFDGTNCGFDKKGNPYTAGNTTVSFKPAYSNSFYYYTEDTPIYTDSDCKTHATTVKPNTKYYYDLPYYDTNKTDETGGLALQHDHIEISIATQDEINKVLKTNDKGEYYVPAKTLKGSYPQAVDNQVGPKESNDTGTATRCINFSWDLSNTTGRLFLGNNGKLGYDAKGSLRITKKVTPADSSYTPDSSAEFKIKVDLEGAGASGSYNCVIDGKTTSFTSGGIITLKSSQTAEIEGLPAGCKYTVTEVTPPTGYSPSYTNNSGSIEACTTKDVTVTNTYAAEPAVLDGEKNLSVTKKLVGRNWGKEEAFTFKIAVADGSDADTPLPNPATLTLTKPKGDIATSNFGDITYTKPGIYKYEITEVEGSNVISQWDKSIYTVIVKVEDNGTGKLNIAYSSVTKNDGNVDNGIYFENTYKPSPDPVKTVKDASGNIIDNTLVSPGQLLTYTIAWANTEVSPNGEPASAEITITDTVPANTTYVLTENGATLDESNNKLTWNISAEPNQSGTVSFTVRVNENISGENGAIDNTAQVGNRSTNITRNYLPGKTVDKDSNTSLKVGDELTYTIHYKNLEDTPADITVTDAVPTGTEFVSADNGGDPKDGTVTWKLAGVKPGADGTVSFKVRVTMDAVGKSIENQAEVKIGDRAPAQTTKTENKNIEKPSSASVTLAAHKTLVSDVGNHTLTEGEFSFNLLDKDGKIVQTTKNKADGNVTFNALSLDTIGDYTYTICEVDGKLGYMTYDTSKYTVSFKVYDAQNGTLAATEPVYSLDGKTVAKAEFTNHYTAELPEDASFSLSASKALTGRSMIDGEFVFKLEDENGNIVATAHNDAEGNIVFPKVGLKDVQEAYAALLAAAPAEPEQPVETPEQSDPTEGGEQATPETAVAAYSLENSPAVVTDTEPETGNKATVDADEVQKLLTRWYTIREYAQGKGGMTYDSNTYMVRVQLADKEGKGMLAVDSIQYFAADGETPLDNSQVIFANSYAAQGVDLTVTAQKLLTGRSLADGEFSFRLSCDDDHSNEQTVTNDANGRITFTLHYDDKNGIGPQESHTYTVTEVRGENDTITYDDTAYTFTVDVTDDGEGHLTTKVTQPETMIFRNVYTPKATSITLAGNKVLNGRAQKAGEFTFELCDANGAVIATTNNSENGRFDFGTLTYDEAGTYNYTVREKNTGAARVTYDTTVYSVTVLVTDNGTGQLTAEVKLPESGLTFTNTYTPEPTPTPSQGPDTTPAPTQRPSVTPAPKASATPAPAPVLIPQTADSFPLVLLIGLLAVSGCVLAVLFTARKRGKK